MSFSIQPKTYSDDLIENLEKLQNALQTVETDVGSLFIGNTKSFTANSSISKGDPVFLRGDGKIESLNYISPQLKPNRLGTFLDADRFDSQNLIYNSTDDLFLLGYLSDKLAAINPTVRLLAIKINSNNSITFGEEIQLDRVSWPIQEPLDLCYMPSTNNFVLVSTGVIATVDVNSATLQITVGTPNYFIDGDGFTSSSSSKPMRINTMGTKVAVSYINSARSSTRTLIADPSDSTINFNAAMAWSSTNGTTWTQRSLPTIGQWYDVVWGGSLFVAVAYVPSTIESNPPSVMTSSDGVTWTTQSSPSLPLQAVTYASTPMYVAVGWTGAVLTSPNGVTWTQQTAAENNSWEGVAWNGTVFAAVATNGTNEVMTSPTGVTWTARSAAENNDWRDVVWASGLSLFVAVSSNGTNRVMTSPDGITWTSRSASTNRFWRSVTWSEDLTLLVAVATSNVMTSANGTLWTDQTAQTGSWSSVTWSSDLSLFIAVGFNGEIMTSANGTAWTLRTSGTTATLNSVAVSSTTAVTLAYIQEFQDISTGTATSIWAQEYDSTSDRLVHGYIDGGSAYLRVGEVDITDNSITYGAATAVTYTGGFAPEVTTTDRIFMSGIDSTRLFASTATINPSTNAITLASYTYFEDLRYGQSGTVTDIFKAGDKIIALRTPASPSTTDALTFLSFSHSGSFITLEGKGVLAENVQTLTSAWDGGNIVTAYTSNKNGGVRFLVTPLNSEPFIAYRFLGISQVGLESGQSGNVLIFGRDTNQEDLIPGQYYYYGDTGLTTTKTPIPIGIAVRSDRLLISNII